MVIAHFPYYSFSMRRISQQNVNTARMSVNMMNTEISLVSITERHKQNRVKGHS